MSINYYESLELTSKATQEEIANAFRRLSLKYHPKRNDPKDEAVNNHYFNKVAEAYEVLSDPNKKGIFDIYGSEGLRKGVKDSQGNLKGGYVYSGNAYNTFERFFGTTNPFALIKDPDNVKDLDGTMFGSAFGGQYYNYVEPVSNVEVDLECTLEELYNGTVKTLVYERFVVNEDGRTTSKQSDSKSIEVFKGYEDGQILKFHGFGNEAPAQKNSDLIVKIKQVKHPYYRRHGNDLIYVQKITLSEALKALPVAITTLDNRKLTIAIDEIISPQTVKVVKNEGMPIYSKDQPLNVLLFKEKKGDLFIKFDIVFPKFIEPSKKEEIINLLEN